MTTYKADAKAKVTGSKATTRYTDPATYAKAIATLLSARLNEGQPGEGQLSESAPSKHSQKYVTAKVGLRQPDHLLYVALEAVKPPGAAQIPPDRIPNPQRLLPQLRQFFSEAKIDLKLDWVQLIKVSGRLPGQSAPLWQEDLLLRSESPLADTLMKPAPALTPVATDLATNPADAKGDINISIGGNLSGQLIVGDNNQAFSYTYNVETGGVVNVAAPPTVRPRATPVALKPRPFRHLLDRKTVLPILQETLRQKLPVEVFADAGFGKTVLMRHLAHDQAITSAFADGVVYLAVQRQMAADLLQSLYDAFYEAVPAFKPSRGQLRQALKDKQALIILNGLTLTKDEVAALLSILPNSTFVLVSKAQVYWQDGAAIALPGLPLPESITLIEQELARPLTHAEQVPAQFLHARLSGNPLQLRRIAAQARTAAQSLVDVVQSIRAESGDNEQSVDERSVFASLTGRLSAKHKSLLALMGAMGGVAITATQAQAISGVSDAANVLNDLSELHLLDPATEGAIGGVSNGYQLSADLTEAAVQSFDPQPWLARATDYFCETAAAQTVQPDALAHLLEWTQRSGNWQQSLALCKSLDQTLSLGGQWAQWQQVMNHSLHAAEQLGNGAAEAWSLHQLGSQALTTGSEQAEGLLSRALWLRQQLGDKAGAAVTRHNLGLILPPLVEEFEVETGTTSGGSAGAVSSGAASWSSLAIGGAITLSMAVAGVAGFLGIRAFRPPPETAVIDPVPADALPPEGQPPSVDPVAKFSFDRSALTFGSTAVGQQTRQSLEILNSGVIPLSVAALELAGPQASDYSVLSEDCTAAPLDSGEQCDVTLTFSPESAGDRTASLILQSNAPDSAALPITGTAVSESAPTPTPIPTPESEPTPAPESEPTPAPESEPTPAPESKPTPAPESEPTSEPEPASEPTPTPTPEPDLPIARNDEDFVGIEGSTFISVLSNDSDPAEGTLEIIEVTSGQFGQTEISDGGIIYYHSGEGTSRDRFTYTIQNEAGETATASVFITVEVPEPASNSNPVPIDHFFEIAEGESITVNLLQGATDPDEDPITLDDVANQSIGGQLSNNGDGSATYTPWENTTGEPLQVARNRFQYRVTDGRGGFGTAVVEIVVIPVEAPPDSYQLQTPR